MFGMGWEDAEATIVSRRLDGKWTNPDMGEFANQGVEVHEYVVDVRPADGSPPFRALLKEPFNAITFKPPEVGQLVRVKYTAEHGAEHKVKFDRSDPGTYQNVPGVPDWRHHGNPLKEANKKAVADAHSGQAEAAWQATLHAAPGSPSPAPADTHTSADAMFANVEARMKQLEDQHAQGLISDDQFAAEQAKVIDEI